MRMKHLLPKACVAAAVAASGWLGAMAGTAGAVPPTADSPLAFQDYYARVAKDEAAPAPPASPADLGDHTSLTSYYEGASSGDNLSSVQVGGAAKPVPTYNLNAKPASASTRAPAHNYYGVGGPCCYPARGFIAGVEASFLWADASNGGGGSISTYNGATGFGLSNSFASPGINGSGNYGFAPRLWLGYQWDRWGIVGRYFDFGTNGMNADPFLSNVNAVGFENFSSVRAYYADLELRRLYCVRGWSGYFSGGVRYALLDLGSGVRSTSLVNGTTLSSSALSGTSAHGTGLTGAIVGFKPLFDHSSVSLFWNLRGSVLWGDSSSGVATGASAMNALGNASSYNGAFGSNGSTMWIGQVQLGLQWTHRLRCLPATAFFRVAGEYQYWNTGGGAFAQSTSTALVNPGAAVTAVATANGDNVLNLYGFTVGTGFNW